MTATAWDSSDGDDGDARLVIDGVAGEDDDGVGGDGIPEGLDASPGARKGPGVGVGCDVDTDGADDGNGGIGRLYKFASSTLRVFQAPMAHVKAITHTATTMQADPHRHRDVTMTSTSGRSMSDGLGPSRASTRPADCSWTWLLAMGRRIRMELKKSTQPRWTASASVLHQSASTIFAMRAWASGSCKSCLFSSRTHLMIPYCRSSWVLWATHTLATTQSTTRPPHASVR